MSRARPDLPAHEIPTEHVVVEIRADPARPGGRLLLLDGVESSYVDVDDPTHLEFEYLRHLARLIDMVRPRRQPMRMLQIGGGPCALARYLDATRKELRATVVERDPGIIEIAREWLGLVTSTRLAVRIADGREVLVEVADASLDLLVVDAFDGIISPHHLLTLEFADEARRVLRPGGLHAINLIDIPPLGLASAAAATLAARYDHLVVIADPPVIEHRSSGNLVIAASDTELPVETLARVTSMDAAPWEVLAGKRLRAFVADAPRLEDGVRPEHALTRLGPLFGRSRPG